MAQKNYTYTRIYFLTTAGPPSYHRRPARVLYVLARPPAPMGVKSNLANLGPGDGTLPMWAQMGPGPRNTRNDFGNMRNDFGRPPVLTNHALTYHLAAPDSGCGCRSGWNVST